LFDAITGQQIARLEPSNPAVIAGTVALSNSTALITGYTGSNSGPVHVFDLQSMSEVRTIAPADMTDLDYFGGALDLDGNIAVIGSPVHHGSFAGSGAAYVFDVTTGMQLAKLLQPTLPGGERIPYFGSRVGIDGPLVVIGVPTDSRHGVASGASFLFNWSSQAALAEFLPRESKPLKFFGATVAISGGYVFATNEQSGVDPGPGTGYLFRVPEPPTATLLLLCVVWVKKRF
jgi:hypothetical protein